MYRIYFIIPQKEGDNTNNTSGTALKKGRLSAGLNLIAAALKLNISDRTLKKYEKGQIKNKDATIFVRAMEIYGDENVGLAYLEEDPVYQALFMREETLLYKIVERLKSAVQAALDSYMNGGNNNKMGFAY